MIDFKVDESNAEFHSRHLLLLEVYIMFNVLKLGGNFVLRIFDINRRFSVGIIYILYRYFSKVAIIKPFSSRSCESERFIVCQGLQKEFPKLIIEYLTFVNETFVKVLTQGSRVVPFKDQVRSSYQDIVSLITPDIMMKNEDFIDAIQGSNMKYAIFTLLNSID